MYCGWKCLKLPTRGSDGLRQHLPLRHRPFRRPLRSSCSCKLEVPGSPTLVSGHKRRLRKICKGLYTYVCNFMDLCELPYMVVSKCS